MKTISGRVLVRETNAVIQQELPDSPNARKERLLCQCFKRLLSSVPEQYRQLIQRFDLDRSDLSEVASEMGLT